MKKSPKPGTLSKRQIAARRREITSKNQRDKFDHYDLEELKSLLPQYLENQGLEIQWRKQDGLECLCPLHSDRNPSFTAQLKDGVWLWKCWPCDLGGTVIDLHAAMHGLSRNSRESIIGVAEVLGRSPILQGEKIVRKRRPRARSVTKAPARDCLLTEALSRRRLDLLSPYLPNEWKADLWHASPLILDREPAQEAHVLVENLFLPEDVLWLGDVRDSGSSKHTSNFRRRDDWLKCLNLPPRIASGVFRAGSESRKQISLKNSSFLIIEADELIGRKPSNQTEREENKKLSAALVAFLQCRLKLSLRAVIDTGGKSLHAWLDRPSAEGEVALTSTLEGLGIDVSVFKQSATAPLRLPGCRHHQTGKQARLLYLNPICLHEDTRR